MRKRLSQSNFSKAQLMSFVLVFSCIGGFVFLRSQAAGTTANLWVDTSGGTCTRSVVPSAYNDAAACSSMQAAVAASQPGDQIIIKAGSYASQNITSSSSSPGVTITGEQTNGSNSVTLSGLHPTGNWLTVTDVNVSSGLDIENTPVGTPNNITFNNIDWTGNWWLSNCCSNITQNGGRIHNYSAASDPASIMFQATAASTPMSNITLNGVEIDHMTHTVSGSHFEAVRTQGWVSNLMIKNSYFHDNGVNSSQVFVSSFTGGTSHTPGPIIIEGNYFDVPVSGAGDSPAFYNINGNMQGLACPDMTVRYNTNKSSMISPIGDTNGISCASGSFANVKISSNIAPRSPGSCNYYVYDHNLWINSSSSNCGTGDQTVASTAAAGLTGDGFHITSSSPAIDKGDPSYCPANDRDNNTRPQGAACDAGADEYVPSANVWVSTTGNDTTCVRGDQTKPCLTLAKAYSLAVNNDVIEIAGGTYNATAWGSACAYAGDGCIKYNPAITANVTVRPAAGQNVTINGSWDILGANHLIIDGQNRWTQNTGAMGITPLNGSACGQLAGDVTLKNMVWHGPITMNNVQTATLSNIDIGGFSYPDGAGQDAWGDSSRVDNYPGCTGTSNNVTLDKVNFHDIYRGDSSSHAECFFIHQVDQITVQNSVFNACPVYNIFLQSSSPGQTNMTIQNNVFIGPCPDYNSTGKPANVVLPAGGQTDCGSTSINEANCNDGSFLAPNWTIRFNTFVSGNSFLACQPAADWNSTDLFYGNLGGAISGPCALNAAPANMANWTLGYNVQFGPKCSATDITSSAANEIDSNHNLITGATAIDLVPAGFSLGCPSTDRTGNVRPQGTACDAGADEFISGGGTQGDLNSDGHVNVTDLSILLSHYGQSATASQGDINADGAVTILDLSILLSHYGM